MESPADTLIAASRRLSDSLATLSFSDTPPGRVTHVYNPLEYARMGWEAYLGIAAKGSQRVMLLGMNPGPWGMAQNGVPFGEFAAVQEWMGIRCEDGIQIGTPKHPHPKRPIQGFDCRRSEVSGRRLWGLMQARFGSADRFFQDHFVANYCPLVFMAESGRNVTPDKLAPSESEPLFRLCDEHLIRTVDALDPQFVIGVGKFAESRIRRVLEGGAGKSVVTVGAILHPSPASPAANRDWAVTATRQLIEIGAWE